METNKQKITKTHQTNQVVRSFCNQGKVMER